MNEPVDYLDRAEEIAKYDALCGAKGYAPTGGGWRRVLAVLAAGDAELFAAMWSFANFAHAFDDVVDESGWDAETQEAAVTMLHDACARLLTPERNTVSQQASLLLTLRTKARLLGWPAERVTQLDNAHLAFFVNLAENPFVHRHGAALMSLFAECLTRCLDGDALAASADPARQALAPAVRCGDMDVLFGMIYLRRGWAALRSCGQFREYDLPDTVKEAA